jgi:hypothetical protein
MTRSRSDLDAAAFWDSNVCLQCSEIFDPTRFDADGDVFCPACFSTNVEAARRVLEIADFVEDPLED